MLVLSSLRPVSTAVENVSDVARISEVRIGDGRRSPGAVAITVFAEVARPWAWAGLAIGVTTKSGGPMLDVQAATP